MSREEKDYQNKILTIPNALSLFRLFLIPVFIWTYCVKEEYIVTTLILVLSGLTDVLDGFIARRFHMISNFGKAFDPVADKLTQLAMLICLLTRFPQMWIPMVLLVIKEMFTGICGLVVIRKTGQVYGAEWHGKLTTCLLYLMMAIHIIWFDIPKTVSLLLVGICVLVMIMSLCLYGIRNIKLIRKRDIE